MARTLAEIRQFEVRSHAVQKRCTTRKLKAAQLGKRLNFYIIKMMKFYSEKIMTKTMLELER